MSMTLPADAPPWAQVLFTKLDRVEQAIVNQTGSTDEMVTARQVDVMFRLRAGTTRGMYEIGDGRLHGQLRRGRSPTGQVLYVNLADARRIWGGT